MRFSLSSGVPTVADVRNSARVLLDDGIAAVWPGSIGTDGFRADLLHGGFDEQFFVANTDPSDRYVQSLPDTATS